MKKWMSRRKFSRLRGSTLMGLGLLIVGLAALLVFGSDFALAGKPEKPGKPDRSEHAAYRIYMSLSGPQGLTTDCHSYGYVLAGWDAAHKSLGANGTNIDPGENIRIPLSMRLLTDVEWTRKYDAGKGLSGVFNDCFGETGFYNGALFITFGKVKRQPIIHFTWHFDYYTAPDVREHFTLVSEDIPFQAWTGETMEGEVSGWFDLWYYLNDPDHLPDYVSLTGDVGRTFNFFIRIEKVTP